MSNLLDSIKGKIKKEPTNAQKSHTNWSEYLGIPYYSSSKIKQYEDNPALYNANFKKDGFHFADEEFTKAKTFGSVLHKFLFEPKAFRNNEDFYLSLLDATHRKHFIKMSYNIKQNDIVKKLTEKQEYAEKVFTWKTPILPPSSGNPIEVYCKMRCDLITSNGWLVDFKTIASLGKKKHGKYKVLDAVNEYRYDLQMAFYISGLHTLKIPVKGAVLVFCEKSRPWECVPFYLGKELLKRGAEGKGHYRGWKQILPEIHFNPKKSRFEQINELEI